MKIAVLSDAHGNSMALEICLTYITNVYHAEKIFFLGDAVGYYPDYKGVLDLLNKNNVTCLAGNHEAMLLGHLNLDPVKEEVYRLNKNKASLSSHDYSFLNSLLPYKELTTNERILFVHGNPFDPLNGYVYPDTNIDSFENLPYDTIFMGHTHYPFIKKIKGKTIINVGSCGMPRDEGDLPSFAVYDTETKSIEIVRKKIDPEHILAFYGENNVHESVRNCLYRKSKTTVVGKTV